MKRAKKGERSLGRREREREMKETSKRQHCLSLSLFLSLPYSARRSERHFGLKRRTFSTVRRERTNRETLRSRDEVEFCGSLSDRRERTERERKRDRTRKRGGESEKERERDSEKEKERQTEKARGREREREGERQRERVRRTNKESTC
jgi:hypothetical protein